MATINTNLLSTSTQPWGSSMSLTAIKDPYLVDGCDMTANSLVITEQDITFSTETNPDVQLMATVLKLCKMLCVVPDTTPNDRTHQEYSRLQDARDAYDVVLKKVLAEETLVPPELKAAYDLYQHELQGVKMWKALKKKKHE